MQETERDACLQFEACVADQQVVETAGLVQMRTQLNPRPRLAYDDSSLREIRGDASLVQWNPRDAMRHLETLVSYRLPYRRQNRWYP